jgi:hypothetical protein
MSLVDFVLREAVEAEGKHNVKIPSTVREGIRRALAEPRTEFWQGIGF